MKMAKADKKDIEAADQLMSLLHALSSGLHPSSIQGDGNTHSEPFDPDDSDHLRALYDALDAIIESAPGMPGRIIGGMCHVILWDKNKIVDPDADTLEIHPKHIQNAMDAQRYRAWRASVCQLDEVWMNRFMSALPARCMDEGVSPTEPELDAAIDVASTGAS